VNSQILTALLFCVTAMLFLVRIDAKNDPNTARISAACGIVTICIMTMAGLSFRHATLDIVIDVMAGFLAAVIVAVMAHRSHRGHPAQ
jgi:hypothetical protein